MPIIKKNTSEIKSLKGLKIEKKILDEVQSYSNHFGVSIDDFANQAFAFVLKKDSDWKKMSKPLKEKVLKASKN